MNFSFSVGSTDEEMGENDMKVCWTGLDEDVGTSSSEERLQELLGNLEDVTGKEDLVTYLRMQVLQKVLKPHQGRQTREDGMERLCTGVSFLGVVERKLIL